MNILIITTGFLLLLSVGSYMISKESVMTALQKISYSGLFAADRNARNAGQSKHYNKMPGESVLERNPKKDPEKQKDPEKEEEKQTYESPRDDKNPKELSKFNLAPLFSDLPPASLYETAVRLICLLYEKTSSFQIDRKETLAKELLNALIQEGKTQKETETLSDLFPKMEPLKSLYYKMLKGTNIYEPGTEIGSPPFEDYFYIDRKSVKKPLFFSYASTILLRAIFGDGIANDIVQKEKAIWEKDRKHSPLTPDMLTMLLQHQTGKNVHMSDFQELLDFAHKKEVIDSVMGIDKETGISVRKNHVN